MTKIHTFAFALVLVLPALPAAAQDPDIVHSAACAPVPAAPPGGAHRIIGTTDPTAKELYGAGEQVVVNAGSERGVQIGQRYFVRHVMTSHGAPRAEDTKGWVQIVAVNDRTAIATIEFACTGMQRGDHLEPYADPVLPPGIERTDASGELDFSKTARVLYGENGRQSGGTRDFIIADMGEKQGATPGARYAIYRDLKVSNVPLVRFGEAIVVSALSDSSVIRVTMARDAVSTGDMLVARIGGREANQARAGADGQQAGGAGGALGEGNVPGGAGGAAGGTATGSRDPVLRFTFEDVYFDFDRYNLRPEALSLLDQAVKALSDSPTLRIQIEGHTCNIGSAEYNLALGERRAAAVRDYLTSRGVAANRLGSVSYGEERPKYENAREETRRLNRRAVLTVNLQR